MIDKIQKKNDFSMMAPMHTVLAGLKALFCNIGYEGVKTMRECCGAAGFTKFSSFGSAIDVSAALVTLEGDSVVMNLQTARALLKSGRQVVVKGKKLTRNLEYINDLPILMQDPKSIRVTSAPSDKEYFLNL
jgi:acyl-CoA oxidase